LIRHHRSVWPSPPRHCVAAVTTALLCIQWLQI
jgi:hypothetical protein